MTQEAEIDALRVRLADTEKHRSELIRLNEFSRLLNSTTELDQVLERIFDYIGETFGIDGVWLLLLDETKKTLRTEKVPRTGVFWSAEAIEYVQDFTLQIDRTETSFSQTIRRRRPLYFPNIRDQFLSDVDREIIAMVQLRSVLMIPLIMNDEAIGLICLTNHDRRLRLKRADVAALSRFCDQIAGAINRSSLYDRLQRERAESDRLRDEIETLNDFSRKINASTSLDEIIDDIFGYLENSFGFEAVILALPDHAGEHLHFYRHSVPDYTSPSQIEFLNTYRVPLSTAGGAIARVFERKKPFYQSRIPRTYFESDEKFVSILKPGALVMVPLVIKDRSIGLVMCTSKSSQQFQRDGMGSVSHFCEQIAGAVYSASLIDQVRAEREKSDRLLRNILPERVAEEIKEKGSAAPTNHDAVTVLFTDFVGFTEIGERMEPDLLLRELDDCFTRFDDIAARHGLEKLKTIGDAYMCAGGLPAPRATHAVDVCLAALEFQTCMEGMRAEKTARGLPFWELRIGIHSGPVTAGVIGKYKFAYDIWGDTVNTASRCESAGVPGRINVSETTRDLVAEFFECEERGPIAVKGKGEICMFFVNRLRPEFAADEAGLVANAEMRKTLAAY